MPERRGPALDALNDTPVLLTPNLELSLGREGDAEALFPYVHGEAGRLVTDTLVWDGPEAVDEMAAFYAQHATATFGDYGFCWVLRDRDGSLVGAGGRAVGTLCIRPCSTEGAGDIGYWLVPPLWGRGLMAEAIAAVVDRAFDHWGFASVVAEVFAHNAAGLRLLEKLGFQRVLVLPADVEKRGTKVDCVRCAVRPGEWVHRGDVGGRGRPGSS